MTFCARTKNYQICRRNFGAVDVYRLLVWSESKHHCILPPVEGVLDDPGESFLVTLYREAVEPNLRRFDVEVPTRGNDAVDLRTAVAGMICVDVGERQAVTVEIGR